MKEDFGWFNEDPDDGFDSKSTLRESWGSKRHIREGLKLEPCNERQSNNRTMNEDLFCSVSEAEACVEDTEHPLWRQRIPIDNSRIECLLEKLLCFYYWKQAILARRPDSQSPLPPIEIEISRLSKLKAVANSYLGLTVNTYATGSLEVNDFIPS